MNELQRLIAGLQILQKYGATTVVPDHDVIYIWNGCESIPETLQNDDAKKLDEYGFHWSIENETWSFYI